MVLGLINLTVEKHGRYLDALRVTKSISRVAAWAPIKVLVMPLLCDALFQRGSDLSYSGKSSLSSLLILLLKTKYIFWKSVLKSVSCSPSAYFSKKADIVLVTLPKSFANDSNLSLKFWLSFALSND